ncbi:unannotated protein [freshwater metagenome]|uniref:Unannotated protein n=1 Tax=freshwater metagenome TaxID=449393 RepID=A0A6J7GI98_9ZZZZ
MADRSRTGERVGSPRRATAPPLVAWSAALLVVAVVSVGTVLLRRRIIGPLGRSPYDGLLHIRQARSLVDGDWLGSYDNLTMVKAPGYSLFLAACHELGVSAKDAEQVVVLLAALAIAACVLATTRRLVWATPVFVVCACDPIYLSTWSADYGRDALFSSITLLVVALLFLTGHLAGRSQGSLWALLPAGLGGAALAAYLLTREEGITVLPVAVAALLASPALRVLRSRSWSRRPSARGLAGLARRVVPAALVLVLATGAPVAAVLAENEAHYGVATTSELAGGAFQGAYAQWQRVEAGPSLPRIPISEEQRRAVYPFSEAARTLEPSLEDPMNQWRTSGCTTPPDCDYAGGWITWALRDAAADAGFFGSAAQSQEFFERLGREIRAACDDGRLTCRAEVPGTLAPLQRVSVTEVAEAFLHLTVSVLSSKDEFWQENRVPWGGVEQRSEYVAVDLGLPVTGAGSQTQMLDYTAHAWQYRALSTGYEVAFPIGVALGLVVVLALVGTARGRRSAGPLTALALVLLFGAVLRIALISVIHVADYDADQPRYLYPAQILLMAFSAVAIVEGLRVLAGRRRDPARADAAPPEPVCGRTVVGMATGGAGTDHRQEDGEDRADATTPLRMLAGVGTGDRVGHPLPPRR